MNNSIQSLLAAPVFPDEEKSRISRLVHIIALALGAGGIITIVQSAWGGHWNTMPGLALGQVIVVVVYWLNRRGRQDAAVHVLVFGMLATGTVLLCISRHGFRDVAILVFPSTLIVAALVLSRRVFIIATLAAMLCVGGVVLADISQLLATRARPATNFQDLIGISILLGVGAVVAGLLSDNLRGSLARARQQEAALAESEARMRQLAGATFEGIGITDQGRIVEVNEQLAQMHGYSAAELVGNSVLNLVAPESRDEVFERIRSGNSQPYEHVALRKDGSSFPVEVRGRRMSYGGRHVRVTAVRDITERKQAEESLRRRLAFDDVLNDLLARFAGAAAAEMDEHIRVSLEQIAGLIGGDYAFLVQIAPDFTRWSSTHEWRAAGIPSRIEAYQDVPMGTFSWAEKLLVGGQIIRVQNLGELPSAAAPLRQRWEADGFKSSLQVPLRGRGGLVNGCIGLFSVRQEVSWDEEDIQRLRMLADAIANALERKRAEEALRKSGEQLRALLNRLQSLREEERIRIAREIHDHLGQLLTAIKLDLRSLERRISGLTEPDARAALNEKVASARQLADETIESVQKIASELRPGILDRLGLAAAVEVEAQAFQTRTGIPCEWDVPQEPREIPQELATAIFRIFQEILTNIARHAQATRAAVRLVWDGPNLVLEASDNGVGICSTDLENPKSLGVVGMQERAAILGGQISFGQNPGGGTKVTVQVPLNGKGRQTQ